MISPKRLLKLKRETESLRRQGGVSARKLEAIARSLGRKKGKRGSEPNWVSEYVGRFPISIPSHGSKDLAKGTARNILDALDEDIEFLLEESFHGFKEEDE